VQYPFVHRLQSSPEANVTTKGRKATANLTGFEYTVLYGRDENFRHEMFHLFGARDYYIPSQVETLAEFSR